MIIYIYILYIIIYIWLWWWLMMVNHNLVGGWPSTLKNDGVKVSWDDDISNIWKDKKPPTSQGVQIFESPTIPTVHSHAGGVCFFVDWLPYWAQSLSSTQKVLRNRRANPKKSEVGLAKEAWAILQITQWQHHFPSTQRPKMPKIRECQMESCYTSRVTCCIILTFGSHPWRTS